MNFSNHNCRYITESPSPKGIGHTWLLVKAILETLQTAQIQTLTSLQSHCRQPPEGTGKFVRKKVREDRGCGKYNFLTPTQRPQTPCALIFPSCPSTELPLSCCSICLNQWLSHSPSGPQKHLTGFSGLSLKVLFLVMTWHMPGGS